MKRSSPTAWVWAGSLVLALLLAGRSSPSSAADAQLDVSSSVTVGTCDVKLGGQDTQTVEVDNVNPDALLNGGVGGMTASTQVNLTLACLGVSSGDDASGQQIPTLIVGGAPVTGGGAATYLFKPNGGATADPRVGVVLSTAAPSGSGFDIWASDNYLIPGQPFVPTGWTGNGQTLATTLYAGLSCGDSTSCGGPEPLTVGELTATITFDFAYK